MEIKPEEYKDYLEEQHLTPHEAAAMLGISQDELKALVNKGELASHNIAGAFLRLKKKDVEELKVKWRIQRELFPQPAETFSHKQAGRKASAADRLHDFWYFNDFYIICGVVIAVLLYFIVSHQ